MGQDQVSGGVYVLCYNVLWKSVKGVTVDDHVPECHVTFGKLFLIRDARNFYKSPNIMYDR